MLAVTQHASCHPVLAAALHAAYVHVEDEAELEDAAEQAAKEYAEQVMIRTVGADEVRRRKNKKKKKKKVRPRALCVCVAVWFSLVCASIVSVSQRSMADMLASKRKGLNKIVEEEQNAMNEKERLRLLRESMVSSTTQQFDGRKQ